MRNRVLVLPVLLVTIFLGTAIADEDTSSLLTQAREAAKAGHLAEAERYHRMAVTAAEQTGDSALIAEAVGDLGGLFLARWRLPEATELCMKSLSMLRDKKDARYLPVVLNNLGVIYINLGDYAQSEAYFKEALHAVRGFKSPDPYEARVLNNFGALYYTMKDLGKAEKAFKKAVAVTEKQLGPNRAELATYLSNLGGLYVVRKKWTQAAALFDRAISLLDVSGKPDQLGFAGILDNQGMMFHLQKNFVESEKPLRRAYNLRLELLGAENPIVVVTQVKLAGTLREMGRYEEAERMYRDALEIYEKTSRLRSMDAAKALEELANLFRQTSREQKAEPLEARAKAIRFDLEHTVSASRLP